MMLIACLCAQWCASCREYQPRFDTLAINYPSLRFRWIDIEDPQEDLGQIDVENFPTLLIAKGEKILFFGSLLPHIEHLERLIQVFCAQTDAIDRAYIEASPDRLAWQADPDLLRLCQA